MKIFNLQSEIEVVSLNQVTDKNPHFIVCNTIEFDEIENQFGLLKQNLNDMENAHDIVHFESHPKYDRIKLMYFKWQNEAFSFEQVDIYVSNYYLIFVTDEEESLYSELIAEIKPEAFYNRNGMEHLSFAYFKFLNLLLSNMFTSLGLFEDELAQTEMNIIRHKSEYNFESIIELKATSFSIKKYLRLLVYIGDQITLNDNGFISKKDLKYFRNIATKMERLFEFGNSLHEKSEHLMDLYDSTTSQKSNNLLNKLTIFTAFATPLTVISGIYGMNFTNMPELQNEYAYFIVLGIMLTSVLITYTILKKVKLL